MNTDKVVNKFSDRLVPVDLKIVDGKKQAVFPTGWTDSNKSYDDFSNCNAKAVRTGGGLMVLDIDTKDLSQLKDEFTREVENLLQEPHHTLTIETRRGYHFYFNGLGFKTMANISTFVDIRGEGGCAFIQADNLQYEQLSKSRKVNDIPKKLEKLLRADMTTKAPSPTPTMTKASNSSTTSSGSNNTMKKAYRIGDMDLMLRGAGINPSEFNGATYTTFNRLAYILAQEVSIPNNKVSEVLDAVIEQVLGFDPCSRKSMKFKSQALKNISYNPNSVLDKDEVLRSRSEKLKGWIK